VRTVVLPFWNALSFFTTYAEVDGYDPRSTKAPAPSARPDIDRWVLSVLQSLIADVNHEMENYRLYNVVPRLVRFIDDLTNWYVRRSRPRFWKSADDADKACAYATLYEVLVGFSKVLAPFMPFLTETVYQKLVRTVDASAPESVHYSDYPTQQSDLIDPELEARMQVVRDVVALGRKLREDLRIRVRQPLRSLVLVHRDPELRRMAERSHELIEDELNVKRVSVEADESSFTSLKVKPNFKALGGRCGPKLKPIGAALSQWGAAEVARLEAGESIELEGEQIALADVLLERKAKGTGSIATDGHLTVVLDATLDDALRREGIAREFVSLIQNARKQAGLEVSDRIKVSWSAADPEIERALGEHSSAIAREILAVQFAPGPTRDLARLNEHDVGFSLDKA
jgi:isoleucyl-tRNA synthetase